MSVPRKTIVFLIALVSVAISGCSVFQAKPVSERVYTFNDLGEQVDVEFGNQQGAIGKLLSIREQIASRLPEIPGVTPPRTNPAEAASASVDYLARNQMPDIKVRVNQYDPIGELKRLKSNSQVIAPLKYTLGLVSVAKYAIAPGPLTKQDSYNPYTNSLHVNSDNPIAAVEQAAFAKKLKTHQMPNLFLLGQRIPGGELPAIAYTTQEVINYYAMYGSSEQQALANELMTKRFAQKVGGEVGDFVPGSGPLFSIAGNAIGTAVALKKRFDRLR